MSRSARKVFDIAGAPDDEVRDIRCLLERSGVSYYETPRANFGVSVAAIWVKNEKDHKKARLLIDAYYDKRARRTRAIHPRKGRNAARWKSKESLFLVFVIILLIWMFFAGVRRP